MSLGSDQVCLKSVGWLATAASTPGSAASKIIDMDRIDQFQQVLFDTEKFSQGHLHRPLPLELLRFHRPEGASQFA